MLRPYVLVQRILDEHAEIVAVGVRIARFEMLDQLAQPRTVLAVAAREMPDVLPQRTQRVQMLAAFAPVECHRRRRVQRDRGIRGQPQHAGETLGARRREALQPVAVAAVERRRRLRQPAPDVVEQFVVQP